jgi:hypothetical protein
MATNADKFCHLFSGFDLVVRCKNKARKAADENDVATGITKSQIKTMLKKATEEYTHAKKLFKRGKISKEELYDFEWRVFELREDLDKLDNEGVL